MFLVRTLGLERGLICERGLMMAVCLEALRFFTVIVLSGAAGGLLPETSAHLRGSIVELLERGDAMTALR